MRQRRAVSGLGVGAAALAMLVSGCGSSVPAKTQPTQLDTHSVAEAIQQSILKERHTSASVSCPLGIEEKAGVKFVCVAQTGATRTQFVVTEQNDKGYVTYVGVANQSK
jgi:hypothetical protein